MKSRQDYCIIVALCSFHSFKENVPVVSDFSFGGKKYICNQFKNTVVRLELKS